MSDTLRILAVLALALGLAACGARGPLEPPPGAESLPPPEEPFVLDKLV